MKVTWQALLMTLLLMSLLAQGCSSVGHREDDEGSEGARTAEAEERAEQAISRNEHRIPSSER